MKKRMIVTTGLPYANGDIHIGHLVEYLQADIWVRFQKLKGEVCHYFCADDTHGTPIMLNAKKKGITPEQMIENCLHNHIDDLTSFGIEFDKFSSTHSQKNRDVVYSFYNKMKEKNLLLEKSIDQLYCNHDAMFLPDRFVKGICPKCGAHEQFGDGCDKCGSTYSTKELKSPQCSLCGSQPVEKQTTHLFFKLNHYKEELKSWVKKHTAPEVANKLLNEWLQEDLKDWDITRDSPYFGFEVPELDNKFFYVWVDAPICYLSTALEWAEENQMDPMVMWNGDDVKIHHFIGKDIIYFHALYWPAMLMAADYKLPHQLHVHGMLQVNGEKMSKTKGTFINARVFRDHFSPELLRYYYASKLTSHATDLDLNLDDFINRINAELVGKITNLFSRGAQMLNKKLDGVIGEMDVDGKRLINKALESAESIEENFDKGDFSKAIQEIRSLAEEGNRYFDEKEPWKLIKNDEEEARRVLSSTLNLCRILAIYLKPVLPNYVEQVEELLNVEALNWKERDQVLQDHSIGEFKPLASRIEKTQVEKMLEEQKQLLQF